MPRGFVESLIYAGRRRVLGFPAREILYLYGIEVPWQVTIGKDLKVPHRGFGVVVHPRTVICERVSIYQQVTIGRYDVHRPISESDFERIMIQDDVILLPGAKIIGGPGITTVGRGTIVAANAVLLQSTGENEIWGGIPARRLSNR